MRWNQNIFSFYTISVFIYFGTKKSKKSHASIYCSQNHKWLNQKIDKVVKEFTLSLFSSAAWKHQTDHGMDSLFCFEDDEDKKKILNILLPMRQLKKHLRKFMRKRDQYDCQNMEWAKKFLMNFLFIKQQSKMFMYKGTDNDWPYSWMCIIQQTNQSLQMLWKS